MQGLVQLNFEYLQEGRFHRLSGGDNSSEYPLVWGLFHVISSTFPLLPLAQGKEERPAEISARKVQFILRYGY